MVRVLGAVFRVVGARCTPARRGVCGLICVSVAVVRVLRRGRFLCRIAGVSPCYVAVVCVLAILRALLARGTLACYGTCGPACGTVVGTL